VWVSVTLLTRPADDATLLRFYELTRPAGPGWNRIRAASRVPPSPDSLPQMMLGWTAGVVFVYAGLFGTGSVVYGRLTQSAVWLVAFLVSGAVLWRVVRRIWSADRPELAGVQTSAPAAERPCTRAVILARGLGTRMRETDAGVALGAEQSAAADSGVKAMIPIGRPFLDYVLSALADAGFTDVCLVVAPDHDAIRDYYTRTAPPTRVRVAFAVQSAPIGTADAVLAAQAFTRGEPFVVLNADNYYPADVLRLLRLTNGAAAVGFTRDGLLRGGNVPAERIAAYALLDVAPDGALRRVIEKPDDASFARLAAGMPVSMNVWARVGVLSSVPGCAAFAPR